MENRNRVSVCASHRVELAGDWSDLPGYCQLHGGRVINMAIDIPGFVIEVHGSRISRPVVEIVSLDNEASEIIASASQLRCDTTANPLFLAKATMNSFVQQSDYSHDLSSFLAHGLDGGMKITTNSTAPTGSGLGTSSILATAIRAVISHLLGEPLDPLEACWQNFLMESSLGLGSGWQDQIGGILPGVKDIIYDASSRPAICFLTPPVEFIEQLIALSVLAYTGHTRYSGDILNQVGNDLKRSPHTVKIVKSLKAICTPVQHALKAGDYAVFGDLVNQMTELQKRLHPGIIPQHIRRLFKEASPYCFGSRICGAGGEGFLLFFAKGMAEKESLIQLLANAELRYYSMSQGSGLEININES